MRVTPKDVRVLGKQLAQVLERSCLKVLKLEAWSYRATKQSPCSTLDQAGALPNTGRYDDLRKNTLGQIVSDQEPSHFTVRSDLDHFDGISKIEVKDLIRADAMKA